MCDRSRNVNCAMLMKFVKSFFLPSCQHELLLNTQGNFENNSQKLKLYPAIWPSTQNTQLQRLYVWLFHWLEIWPWINHANFSMLQLAFERYVWLRIASGKAITGVHNKKENLKEKFIRKKQWAWMQASCRVLLIKSLGTYGSYGR